MPTEGRPVDLSSQTKRWSKVWKYLSDMASKQKIFLIHFRDELHYLVSKFVVRTKKRGGGAIAKNLEPRYDGHVPLKISSFEFVLSSDGRFLEMTLLLVWQAIPS